jgi:hypothetical protein
MAEGWPENVWWAGMAREVAEIAEENKRNGRWYPLIMSKNPVAR